MRTFLVATLLTVGCHQTSAGTGLSGGGGSTPLSSTGEGSSTTAASTSTSGSGTTTSASTGGDSSTSVALPQDMGSPDLPPGSVCNGKIDLVFVIDQGGALDDFIGTLYDAYPEFLATIEETFADVDLHVMFVDPNASWGAVPCPKGMCPEEGGCPADGYEDYPCWALYDENALTKCDSTMGAGIIFPAGRLGINKPCVLPLGQRFITGDDPLFVERFSCLGRSGVSATSEPGWALGQALSLNLQVGCNAGFLRDDALLMPVIVTTRDFGPYNPYVWAQRVLEAKGFDQDMIVALGIADDSKARPDSECGAGNNAPNSGTFEWTQEFEHHVFGSICAPAYAPFFAEAAEMAADLCANGPQN